MKRVFALAAAAALAGGAFALLTVVAAAHTARYDSTVTIAFQRGHHGESDDFSGKVVSVKPAVVVGHGKPTLNVTVPRKAGTYDVAITAVDLAGNVGTAEGTIDVLKPKKRKRGR